MSACLHFQTPQNQSQHHLCQLVCIFEHLKTKASIIGVSLFAFSNTSKPRPASFVSACLHFRTPQNQGQHHRCQLVCIFEHPKTKAASSVSAWLHFRTPQNQGQHHRCQLVCIFEHPKTKASIICVSLFAFSNAPKARPASSVSACLHFRTPQNQGQYHLCQLVCIFEHPKTKASIIGVSLFAFSNTPKPRPASSLSACLHFRTPQNQGQHHRCQLGCIFEHPKTKASIICVSLFAFSNTPKPRPASSVSAWLHFRTPQNQGQHHRCQLGGIFEHPTPRPASFVSACLHFRTPQNQGQHHRCQLVCIFEHPKTKASIICVSLFAFSNAPKPRPASSVSACLHFRTPQNQGQHNRCQLVCIFEHPKTKASIIGVSLFAFSNTPKPRPASFVSACLHFRTPQNQGQHHRCQLVCIFEHPKTKASIICVSLFAFSNTPKARPASSVSACLHFRTPQNQGQHHLCQLVCIFEHPKTKASIIKTKASIIGVSLFAFSNTPKPRPASSVSACIFEHPKTKASIIAVSLVAFSNTPKPRPASSVSAWLHFRTPQNQGQHHRCQLVCIFEHPKTKASIIAVSLFAFSNTPKSRPASSVSACLHFRTPQNQGQHHRCQLVCIFEHPKTKASIIGVSLFAFSNTPKPRPASSVSAWLHFRTPQNQGQHHLCQLVCIFEHPKTKARIIGVSLVAFPNTPKPRPA